MSASTSCATGRKYPLAMVCEVMRAPRSSVYAQTASEASGSAAAEERAVAKRKRGPKTPHSDEQVLVAIREAIAESPFHGEGHRKVRRYLRNGRWKMKIGRQRMLRLMRENALLAPVRRLHVHGSKAHDGQIITGCPNDLWGADGTTFWTEEQGLCWFFGTVDHFNSECVGWHVAKRGTRWAAIESLRNGVRGIYGAYGSEVAKGLALRHDWGSQYTSGDFGKELKFLGIADSPAYVAEPQTNGVAERFIKTLKEECIYMHRFKNVEEARRIIGQFIEKYNRLWMIERLDYRSPAQARADYLAENSGKAA